MKKDFPPFLAKIAGTVRKICAFDNDRGGDDAAKRLGDGWERMRPTAKDWNDDLRAPPSPSSGSDTTSDPSGPSL